MSGYVWHQQIMVSQYQPRAMIVVLALHNLITLISHCLVNTPESVELTTSFVAHNPCVDATLFPNSRTRKKMVL